MISLEQVRSLHGRDVYDTDGDKIGTVGQVWHDGAGQPTWASVKTGLFGLNESFVPLQDADLQGDRLVLPYDKARVKDAPNVDADDDEPLTENDVERLYEHYGLNWRDSYQAYQAGAAAGETNYRGSGGDIDVDVDRNRGVDVDRDRGVDVDVDRDRDRGIDAGGDAMTRSEQRLNVDKQREEVGRARLRKYVVTEHEQVTVPVEREQVTLEREPITDANRGAAVSGPDITEAEHEVTLHADRAVADTETVPVERVRLNKETVQDEETVSGEVRKERIEADLPDRDQR